MSFLVVLILGGGPRYSTIEVGIYQAIKVELDIALAARLALAQMAVSFLVYFLFLRTPARIIDWREPCAMEGCRCTYFARGRKSARPHSCYGLVLLFLVAGPLAFLAFQRDAGRPGGLE